MFTKKDVKLCISAIKCEDGNKTIEYAMEYLFSFFVLCFKAIEKIDRTAKGEKNVSFERSECLALINELRDAWNHKETNGLVEEGYNDESFKDIINRIDEVIKEIERNKE